MKIVYLFTGVLLMTLMMNQPSGNSKLPAPVKPDVALNELTPEEARVILEGGTERPFTGKYTDHSEEGIYLCRQCDAMLYSSKDKFKSGCGWPSFDDEMPGAVRRLTDADGRRIEIRCATCDGHLGHVFEGEGFTEKDTRHCVNSISMTFKPAAEVKFGEAVFAGGCFWGVEYFLQQIPGVLATTVGYTGGTVENPTYEQVCQKNTGHVEAVHVLYDPVRVGYEPLAKMFFETHDPTQTDGQGPDLGPQYLSEIFVFDAQQRETVEKLIGQLEEKGLKVATKIREATRFWPAEGYHQDYYLKKGSVPYCHGYTKRF